MAAWRRKALELFPELLPELENSQYTCYMLFFDLLPMSRRAQEANDSDLLGRIYGFAEWCLVQKTKEPGNAAGVAFFEHVLDQPTHWKAVVPWLSPRVIADCWSLWEGRLSPDELDEVQLLISNRKEHMYRDAGCIIQ
jgi:hypothetical protein